MLTSVQNLAAVQRLLKHQPVICLENLAKGGVTLLRKSEPIAKPTDSPGSERY